MNRHDRRELAKEGNGSHLASAGVPILNQPGYLNPSFPTGIIKHLIRDDEPELGPVGTVRTTSHMAPNGAAEPDIRRDLYMDAEELIEAIARRVVEMLDDRTSAAAYFGGKTP